MTNVEHIPLKGSHGGAPEAMASGFANASRDFGGLRMSNRDHNSRRPAPRNVGPDRNDNVAILAHTRRYSGEDLARLADEAGKVMGIPAEESVSFAGNPHRAMAAVRTALCLLGFRAEQAADAGAGPGTAWAAFDDLLHLARTLGTPAERDEPQDRPAPASRPAEDAPMRTSLSDVPGADALRRHLEERGVNEDIADAAGAPAPRRRGRRGGRERANGANGQDRGASPASLQ